MQSNAVIATTLIVANKNVLHHVKRSQREGVQ